MKTTILTLSIFLFWNMISYSQEKLEIAGAIQISDSEDMTPDEGTIRYNSTLKVFEGWNGTYWVSLTGEQYVYDIENNRYRIVTIGTQVWMAENLRVTRFNDGTEIPIEENDITWSGLSTPAMCWYDNIYDSGLGALYNFYTADVANTRNVCPNGWHIPSYSEWIVLSDFLGGSGVAGGKMKKAGLDVWMDTYEASNESGFTGLGGGDRDSDGLYSYFGEYESYWSSTIVDASYAWLFYLSYDEEVLNEYDQYEYEAGVNVRCLKD